MDLNHLILFKKIADFGSITKTALDLGMPKSAVSQKLARLEESIGARLFHRNTRKIVLTEIGQTVYSHTNQIQEQRDALLDAIASSHDEPSGLIRITAPPDIGAHITRTVIKQLTSDHPSLSVELDLSTRYVDLINEGFDLAVRASDSKLEDSNLIATKLRQTSLKLFASLEYLNSLRGIDNPILEPLQIKNHPFVAYVAQPGMKMVRIKLQNIHSKNSSHFEHTPTLSTRSFQGVFEGIKAGLGIGLLPAEICQAEVASGEIIPLLPDWQGGEATFYAVYPSKKFLTARVKLMLHYLATSW